MAKAPAKQTKKKAFKKREKRNVPVGLVHVQATFNNTIVTFTDTVGNVVAWSSSGSLVFGAPARARRSPPSRPR
jgi:small subunit ribosomal protein S11